MAKRALILLHPGFEELEAVAPADILARAGVEITQASLTPELRVTGRNGITLAADRPLDAPDAAEFDLIVLPGGPGIKGVREDGRCSGILRAHHGRGAWLGCICAAPLVLLDAGLLPGPRYTAHASTRDELPDALEDPVVVDGRIVTSAGAGTAIEFGLSLAAQLAGAEAAREVAASIEWRGGC